MLQGGNVAEPVLQRASGRAARERMRAEANDSDVLAPRYFPVKREGCSWARMNQKYESGRERVRISSALPEESRRA